MWNPFSVKEETKTIKETIDKKLTFDYEFEAAVNSVINKTITRTIIVIGAVVVTGKILNDVIESKNDTPQK